MTFDDKIVIAYFFLMEMRKVDYLWSVVKFTPKTQKLQFHAAFLWGQFGNPFFRVSYDYVSILPNPPTHPVTKCNNLALPTHPPFWLRNTWMVPYSWIFIDYKMYHFIADSLLKDAVLRLGVNLRLCLFSLWIIMTNWQYTMRSSNL